VSTVLLHFVIGSIGALLVYVTCVRISGARRFSAPFGVVFVGIACAALAHFLSPWATLVVLLLHAAAGLREALGDRRTASRGSPPANDGD
jgi:hypothetical protein